jgi:hypothetical protein
MALRGRCIHRRKIIKLLIFYDSDPFTNFNMRHPVPWVNPSMCETSWDEERHKTDEPYNEFITCFHES